MVRTSIIVIFISLIIYVLGGCYDNHPSNSISYEQSKKSTSFLNLSDSAKYVGIESCKTCHEEIYNSFSHTGMGMSIDTALKQNSIADLSKNHTIYDPKTDYFFSFQAVNNQLKITEFRILNKDTVHKREEFVSYIIGSGQHTNSHLLNINGFLYQMPMTFYAQKGKWSLPPGFEDNNSRFTRTIETECITCHNAYPTASDHADNKYSYIPKGVDCERCHGPGSIHVSQKKEGKLVNIKSDTDFTIVNPKKLAINLQMSVCQRCHLQGNAVLKAGKTFFDFKPGMQLHDVISVFSPRYEGQEEAFIMASHSDRLMQSACFKKSKNMSCITCHNPHKSFKETPSVFFNAKCVNCHKVYTCKFPISKRIENGNNCFQCHMPKSSSTDIPHVSITDHKIQRKKPIVSKIHKRFIGLASLNNPSPDELTLAKAYLQQYEKYENNYTFLDSAYTYLNKHKNQNSIEYETLKIHYLFLKGNFNEVVKYSLNVNVDELDAWTNYRVGESYDLIGDPKSALKFYSKSVSKKPEELNFLLKKGGALLDLDRNTDAKKVFESVLKLNPKYTSAITNLGFTYLKLNLPKQADSLYTYCYNLDPDYLDNLLNRVGLDLYNGNKLLAKKHFGELFKKYPNNERVLKLKEFLKQT